MTALVEEESQEEHGSAWEKFIGEALDSLSPIDPPDLRRNLLPMPDKKKLLDLQFIETRHRLLDLAAFLDRIDRHPGDGDFRIDALKAALPILLEDRPDRARAILDALSDTSIEPAPHAAFQGAFGAPPTKSA